MTTGIDIELTTPPKVVVEYRKSTGGTETVETGRTDTTANTVMTSETEESSWSVTDESSSSVQTTVGIESRASWQDPSISISSSLSLTSSVSHSDTRGKSFSWTRQQSQENQVALSEMRSHSRNKELSQEGGSVKVGVAITNIGHIPFTVQNLSLTAFRGDGKRLWPVAQLEADSAKSFFEMGTWVPGERVELAFAAPKLALSEVEDILTGDLLVQPSKYELKDENGQSFSHRVAAIEAACVRVVVDYGGVPPAESYMVSTRGMAAAEGVAVSAILDALGIPYKTGTAAWTYRKRTTGGQLATGDSAMETGRTRDGLMSLRGVAVDPHQGGYWLLTHETPALPSGFVTQRYDLLADDYKLESIRIKSRQTIRFAYIRDPDHDDLDTRAETAYGTDPRHEDTDRDGVADGDELRDGTDPLRDNALPPPRIASLHYETAGQQLNLVIGVPVQEDAALHRLRVQWGDGSVADEVLEPRETVTCSHRYAAFGKYSVGVTPYAAPRSPGRSRCRWRPRFCGISYGSSGRRPWTDCTTSLLTGRGTCTSLATCRI
jgi:hypothetical protein